MESDDTLVILLAEDDPDDRLLTPFMAQYFQ